MNLLDKEALPPTTANSYDEILFGKAKASNSRIKILSSISVTR